MLAILCLVTMTGCLCRLELFPFSAAGPFLYADVISAADTTREVEKRFCNKTTYDI